ncbi:MAG: NADH-quinone oxidoreductase subunit C [Candidatus Latescibacteria bacterium]|nr:NADH-quinone oxidoreductase subunit C [Candidatus Latescibacterota bacterium]
MTTEDIRDRLIEEFGEESIFAILQTEIEPEIEIAAGAVLDAAQFLKGQGDLSFDVLMCLSALDVPTLAKKPKRKPKIDDESEAPPQEAEPEPEPIHQLAVVYHLFSVVHKHRLALKTFVAVDEPHVPSVIAVWPAADWHEREAFDMMGIQFDGHPFLKRILLPDDWEGHPLRKDYETQETYDVNDEAILVPKHTTATPEPVAPATADE